MSIPAVQALSALPAMPAMPSLDGTTSATGVTDPTGVSGAAGVAGTASTQSTSGAEFGNLLADGLDRLEGLQNDSSNLAVKAATGDLSSIHDYTIAAAEASTATQLAVSLRNTGLQAFNQIMSLQI
ncbi:flagellar hook-basal body complex protein FliE [Nocardioides sp.]|jgi:flagellar hook-basal body complex protein FliE|uniref:flagellar hook-basal body complex protein FliE n=1 Tax=Nocardioides sp. TaxID=35761 RepID=UPI002D1B8048|nr:flagellar hook-basal body complex protein FliE [Nocardioides sp.]HVX54569.1 flagellar hook-basal body complex protein FliE [Nocardioides sp.]